MDTLRQDLRYAMRQLWRTPTFALAALLTLALGIGANSALYTIAQAILARPMPGVQESDRLVWVTAARRNYTSASMSYPDFRDYQLGLQTQADLAAVADVQVALAGRGEPERVRAQLVSAGFFPLLRTPFALGRGFVASEDVVGRPQRVAVLSHALWQRRFNGDSGVIGRDVIVNGQPLTVVGVTMEGFNGADLELQRHLWLPMALMDVAGPGIPRAAERRDAWWVTAIGRLRPGVTLEETLASARTVASRIAATDTATHAGITAYVHSAKSGVPPGSGANLTPLTLLAGVVTGLILLIACANVSNLLLARAVARRREVGIRLSVGATRWRLVRQLFTESLLLSGAAGFAGLLLAYWATEWLISSGVLPLRLDVSPDAGVIAFTLGATAIAALLFGLVPALEATRVDPLRAVQDGGQGRDPRRTRLQSGFVVTQLALSMVLLTTAGLFLRSMYKAQHVEIGFAASPQVLAASFDLGLQRYSDARAEAFLAELAERVERLPGVQRVSYTDVVPLGPRYVGGEMVVERSATSSRAGARDVHRVSVFQSVIRPGYFETLGMRLVVGRDFGASDDRAAPAVAIVGERFARDAWPGEDPIGKRISLQGERGPFLTVVGIASDVLLGGPTEARRSVVYLPQTQHPDSKLQTLLVRTTGDPGTLATALRAEVRRLDPNLPLHELKSLAEYKRHKLADRMNGAGILGGFGALALLLASIGVYGVMAFTVVQRTREVGIRIALGARGRDVIALFLRRSLRHTAIGVVVGLALSLALSRLLRGMFFGLTPADGATVAGVTAILTTVALAAAWIPARRAARVNPVGALKHD